MDDPKKFLVKDFIKYATPCFGCGKPNNFYLGYNNILPDVKEIQPLAGQYSVIITEKYLEVHLEIKYNSMFGILIFHKNNKVITQDINKLNEFLKIRNLFLWSHCHQCSSEIRSQPLTFNFNSSYPIGSFVNPTTISYEFFKIIDRNNTYFINSTCDKDQTTILVTSPSQEEALAADLSFTLPFLPKYQMKNKEYLINKIRTYILYS